MTEQRKSKFKKGIFASLFNSLRGHTYKYSSNNIVQNRDAKLKRYGYSGNGTAVALEVLGDPFAQSCYDRLLETMAASTAVVTPYSQDQADVEAARFIEETYIDIFREILIETAALSKITGCSAHENNYELRGDGKIIIKSVTPVDSERLIYSVSENSNKAELRIQTLNNPFDGELPPADKIVDFTYYSVYINNPYGTGVGSQLIEYVDYKNRMLELWLRAAENYTTPIKIGNIPDTAEESEIDELFDNFKNMSENATFLLPPGFTLDVVDVSSTGVDTLVKSMIDYCDERIATLILGENLTGREIANGAQARDNVATKITERKAMSQLAYIANRLNETTISYLSKLNFPKANPPRLSFVYNESIAEIAANLEAAKRIGIPLDVAKAAEMLGVPIDLTKLNKKVLGANVSLSGE